MVAGRSALVGKGGNMKTRGNFWIFLFALGASGGCPSSQPPVQVDGSNYVVKLEQMDRVEAGEGELIYILRGEEHGFEGLSFILTETAPGGGPPEHTHTSEEAHVLHSGSMQYVVNGETFEAQAPYIVRIPAGTPHTFVNSGDEMLNLTAVFASPHYDYQQVGPNPLQE